MKMNIRFRWLWPLLAVALPLVALAGTYKWVDKNGNVHYSDTPPPEGAQEVELPKPMTFEAPDVPHRPAPDRVEAEAAPAYRRFEFISPKQDQVFWAVGGEVPVQLAVEPALRDGDRVQLFVNGELTANSPLGGLGTTLTDVYRGAHSLRAVIVDVDGNEILSTAPVTFHVKQRSIPPQTARPPGKK